MTKKRSIFGSGPRIVVSSLAYAGLVFLLQARLFPGLRLSGTLWFGAGCILLFLGLCVLASSIIQMAMAFRGTRLETGGIYGYVRHPLYASFIMLIAPGLALMSGSLLALTIPPVMCGFFCIFIREEERALEEVFGDKYRDYRRRVNAIIPRLRRR
jgi:protein-S-isoprenylcysteine O-methyltransferase Ste14